MGKKQGPSVLTLLFWLAVLFFCIVGLVTLMFYAVGPVTNPKGE